ncbi:MAG: DUF6364 family protein [Imperialibacter sp.]|uniref:DUF6364 family protein n=1 Tax=Imperialibacter sp. TaxID=2038411 RepID=UPI0032EB4034
MKTKLTLNLDKEVIEQAKLYAKAHKVSLSKLIESYLLSLMDRSSKAGEITPLVRSLSGVIKIDNDFDYKRRCADYFL